MSKKINRVKRITQRLVGSDRKDNFDYRGSVPTTSSGVYLDPNVGEANQASLDSVRKGSDKEYTSFPDYREYKDYNGSGYGAGSGMTTVGGKSTSERGGSGYAGYGKFSVHKCTCDPEMAVIAIRNGRTRLFGSSAKEVAYFGKTLIVDLSGTVRSLHRVTSDSFPARFKALSKYFVLPDVLEIPWPDFGSHKYDLQLWKDLYDLLPDGDVSVCCGMGHGRTGTFLSIMTVLDRKFTGPEAIKYIRGNHCKSAVETAGQEDMVQDVYEYFIQGVK